MGPVPIPEIAASGTWPLPVDDGLVRVLEPQVAVYQFGTGDAKREQRFYIGDGQRRIQLSLPDLNTTRKKLVTSITNGPRRPVGGQANRRRQDHRQLHRTVQRSVGRRHAVLE